MDIFIILIGISEREKRTHMVSYSWHLHRMDGVIGLLHKISLRIYSTNGHIESAAGLRVLQIYLSYLYI